MVNEIDVIIGGFDDGRTSSVQQYDAGSRQYLWHLWERPGVPFEMDEDALVGAIFDWKGAPPSHEYKADMVDRSTVLVTVPAAATQRVGPVDMQVAIHQDGGVLHSPVICFMALKSLRAADEETDEPALLLVWLVDETRKALGRMEKATYAIENMQVRAEPSETLRATITTEDGVKVITFGLLAGKHPYIGENGNWYVYDLTANAYVDSGMYSGGQSPEIGANGNWYISGEDTGVAATGPAGKDGEPGAAGKDGQTPEKGVDYWTTADVAEIQKYVDGKMPTALKNPHALTFTGAVEETYDGSTAKTVYIPTDKLPDYWQEHMDVRVPEIRAAMSAAGYDKSAFLFWNDAHWTYAYHTAPALLKYLYKHTPINKTAFGGDIIDGEGEGQATDMEYLWDWRDMLRDLPNHHSVAGNHDDGETIDNRFDDAYVYAYLLAAEETAQVMRGSEGLYYLMDEPAEKTRYLYLDTATADGNFYVNAAQIDWLKNALLTTPDGWHIVAIAHKWQEVNRSVTPAVATGFDLCARIVLEMLDSYNQRRGDYARCTGWVEFCVGGHTHVDGDYMSEGGIPVILTQTASRYSRDNSLPPTEGTTNETAVSAIVGNYTDNVVNVIRVGRGSSRTVALTQWVRADNPLPPVWPDDAGYTNVLKAAGYKENRRYSASSGEDVPAYGWDLTGFIACKKGDVLRFRNMTWYPSAENEGRSAVYWFDADGDYITNATINTAEQMANWNPVYDAKGNVLQVTLPVTSAVAYIRICCQELSEASVITVNEPTETCNNVLWEAGFTENLRYSETSSSYVEAPGWDLSGFIAAGKGSVIRFKNMQVFDLYGTGGDTSRAHIYWYDANRNYLTLADFNMMDDAWQAVYSDEGDLVQFTIPDTVEGTVQYVRIGAKNITKDSIITVDEQIK